MTTQEVQEVSKLLRTIEDFPEKGVIFRDITTVLKDKKGLQIVIKDFTEREQEQIKKGLSTAVLTDKEAAKKILALVPEEWIKAIPFLVRGHATTKTVQRIAKENPELYAVAKQEGELPEKEREELREIITGIFQQKMNKHNIK